MCGVRMMAGKLLNRGDIDVCTMFRLKKSKSLCFIESFITGSPRHLSEDTIGAQFFASPSLQHRIKTLA